MGIFSILILVYIGQIIITLALAYLVFRLGADPEDRTVGDFVDWISDDYKFYWFMVFFPYIGLAIWILFILLLILAGIIFLVEKVYDKHIKDLRI